MAALTTVVAGWEWGRPRFAEKRRVLGAFGRLASAAREMRTLSVWAGEHIKNEPCEEREDAWQVLQPPEYARAEGGYWTHVAVDSVFGTALGYWRIGEGTEPVEALGYTLFPGSPSKDKVDVDNSARIEMPRGTPLEYRVRALPLWAPGDLEGRSFTAEVSAVPMKTDSDIERVQVLREEDGTTTARGYDQRDEDRACRPRPGRGRVSRR